MKLASLRLDGFLGAPSGDYVLCDTTGKPKPLVLVTGGARCGKSSFLEAIGVMRQHLSMTGPLPSPEALLARGARKGELAASWVLSEDEQRYGELAQSAALTVFPLGAGVVPRLPDAGLARVFGAGLEDRDIGKVFKLGPERRWPRRAETIDLIPTGPQVDASFATLPFALAELAARDGERAVRGLRSQGLMGVWDQPDSLEPLRQMLIPALPHLRLDTARRTERGPDVLFSRSDGELTSAFELSTSERAVLLVATVFFLLRLERSVVLIDEPELHIPPPERAAWLRALMSFGADNQIIVASDAPEIAAEVPRTHHVVLRGRA